MKRSNTGSITKDERHYLTELGYAFEETTSPLVVMIRKEDMEDFEEWRRANRIRGRWVELWDTKGWFYYFPDLSQYVLAKLRWS